jgi:formylglycine-generating enzyme required for sulfatase activity
MPPRATTAGRFNSHDAVVRMQRWFLSYHSPDQALAERLKAAIESKDSGSHVYFAPSHLRAGGFWTAQLAQEIADASAFILLVGERGLGPWQVLEYDEALDRRVKEPDFPIILVLLEGQTAPGLPFLRRLHWIVSPDPASEKDVARLFDGASSRGTRPSELWRYTSPYRGLAAMEEKDSDYFFGRTRETVEVLKALVDSNGLPVLIGNSGVGKSSLALAGVFAALKSQAWPADASASNIWPQVFQDSRQWCFLKLKPGTEPLRALVEPFLRTWQLDSTDPQWEQRRAGWIANLLDGTATVSGLIDATERRYEELGQRAPPAFFLYIDQGEELYTRAEERQRRRFSELLARAVTDPRLRIMMSLRADFFGEFQQDEALHKVYRQIEVPPLREAELREVVSRPANLLSARFESDSLVDIIARRAAEDSVKDAGALPLLSYTLDDMWTQMVREGDGKLRLPAQSFELGGVLVDRANAFLATHPGAEDALRRVLTLRCATVREDGEPTRRRAPRSDFSEDEWRLVSELADYPNRLLVTATLPDGETYAEVAHEAIFRRWDKLRDWIVAEREFLAWRSGLEVARRAWQAASANSKDDALLMGLSLTKAQSWLAARPSDLPESDRKFIALSSRAEQRRRRRVYAMAGVAALAIVAGLLGWVKHDDLRVLARELVVTYPFKWAHIKPLPAAAEHALKPLDPFRECTGEAGTDYCPEMIVVRAGSFTMGSLSTEKPRFDNEGPAHPVKIATPFAVSKFVVTFDEWDACVAYGDCPEIIERPWGGGRQPVINVNFDEARRYVAWLSGITGKPYRLLSEAEYEYAARAGTQTAYPWGDEVGNGNADCDGCGTQWGGKQTAPVGSYAPNPFGLYDMVGNVFEWTADCMHTSYKGAPEDGSAWTEGDNCATPRAERVARGASWLDHPEFLRSANRMWFTPDRRVRNLGFRVARTLAP